MRITKQELQESIKASGSSANVRRLARSLRIRNLDSMSDKQVIRFITWLFRRQERNKHGLETLW